MKVGLLIVMAVLLVACGSSGTRVVIPQRMRQADLVDAFDVARSRDLTVTTTQPFAVSSLRIPRVVGVTPAAGSTVRGGSNVTLTLGAGPIGSPAVLKSKPHYRVPSFVGKPALAAVRWAGRHSMFWAIASLPPLRASKADHLFDAYVVTAQSPRAGGVLTQGKLVGRTYHVQTLSLTVAVR